VCDMGPIVDCPGGCSIRKPENDILGWWKHIQRQHRPKLHEWLENKGILPTADPNDFSDYDPGADRTLILPASDTNQRVKPVPAT